MSEEMAVSDNAKGEDAVVQSDDATTETFPEEDEVPPVQPPEPPVDLPVELPVATEDPEPTQNIEPSIKQEPEISAVDETAEPDNDIDDDREGVLEMDIKDEFEATDDILVASDQRGIKRRASDAFSDEESEFKGFEEVRSEELGNEYSQVLERLEAEIAATKDFTPLRTVMATPSAPARSSKRQRKDTDGSRPSSALSSRSEDDLNPSASPAARGRRTISDMSSPLYRVPLDRGWKRELVYRAALDAHSRRNADIYYYTPYGKKLRSTREVGEHLSGTGLTLDNFSFFKEPLGVDDPEKEIIRDAKLMRRVESPIASPAPLLIETKRTPKPKPPKGADPEPATPKSPPLKLKVKSVGARLSAAAAPASVPAKKAAVAAAPAVAASAPVPTASTPDNNNSAAWKKPRAPHSPALEPETTQALPPAQPVQQPPPAPPLPAQQAPAQQPPRQVTPVKSPPKPVTQPPPLQSKPLPKPAPDLQSPRQLVQPCSIYCGAGVPSLSCTACLCMYHPACAGFKNVPPPARFLCKNCCKSSSPPREPPPLTHKSGVTACSGSPPAGVPAPRSLPALQAPHKPDKRVLLRMKVSSGGADGERVWAVAQPRGTGGPRAPPPLTPPPVPPAPRLLNVLPQSLAIINGRRFIIVPRAAPLSTQPTRHTAANDDKRRTRVTNGTPSTPPMAAVSPRRRGRAKDVKDDVDHFKAFYDRAKDSRVIVQIFQYLGMRELAHCARVCHLWKELAATPALWRHVRMKNSQVNDWGGLCAALKRHGTKWLDLRKMLLPQNDTVFWDQFAQHIAHVDSLERLEMCRCPARAVEAVCRSLTALRSLSALAIKDAALDPAPLACPTQLRELRLKSMQGLALTADLTPLANLKDLQHLSLTSIKELGWKACDVVGELPNLESLELGECTFREEFGSVLARLSRLRRLRLERGTAHCAAPALLRALARLPNLTRLELVNIDVKVGFDDALAECKNIQRLLIIPTYVSQSATTNKQVLSGVLRLKETLTHLMWGVTIELLRVTELFIDQCSAGGAGGGAQARRELGECIPVLKPVPGCRLPMDHQLVAGPPQVEILPLPTLQRLLSAQLPNTKLKLLRIPFHATWRQSLADFQ